MIMSDEAKTDSCFDKLSDELYLKVLFMEMDAWTLLESTSCERCRRVDRELAFRGIDSLGFRVAELKRRGLDLSTNRPLDEMNIGHPSIACTCEDEVGADNVERPSKPNVDYCGQA
jgi:hypothetical protein